MPDISEPPPPPIEASAYTSRPKSLTTFELLGRVGKIPKIIVGLGYILYDAMALIKNVEKIVLGFLL